MYRNIFIDPAGNKADYPWAINHSDEESAGRSRNIEHGARTGHGFVRQQSDGQALTLKYSGTILTRAQLVTMQEWWGLCEEQSIHLTDFADDRYEIIITNFDPTRHRTIYNPRDRVNAPLWYWKYTIEMDVITVLEGVWEGIDP